ncbi:MAG: hypothetical protein JW828_05215 [Sedimentisphaerales bacterium]|nr:hypothetical protein [Sedimentisphaerales bacterium]
MKSIAASVVVGILALGFVLAPLMAGTYSGGTGFPDDPYQIATPADLIELGETPDDYANHFILTANINLNEQGPGIDGTFILAIIAPDTDQLGYGYEGSEFTGVFDGDGFLISNLTINTQAQDYSYLGLFGSLGAGSIVVDLGLENVTIITGWNSQYIGCLCGRSDGLIKGCFAQDVNVIGKYYVGGLCGHNESGMIANSFTTGLVQGQSSTGGLCGGNGDYRISAAILQYSSSTAMVGHRSGTSYKLGGLCGENWGTVSQSYATGYVRGQYYVGGLCGGNYGTIVDGYAGGRVEGDYGGGGLCGQNDRGKIIRCYSSGRISVADTAGGLCGAANTDGTYGDHGVTYEDSANFWDVDSSGISVSAMGAGLYTSQMQNQSTFTVAGWDFVGEGVNGTKDIWRMCIEDVEYPHLAREFSRIADLSCPDGVMLEDLLYFADRWQQMTPETIGAADVDGDGKVTLPDFAVLSEYWLAVH